MKRLFSFLLILLIFGIADFSLRGFGEDDLLPSSNRVYGYEKRYVYADPKIQEGWKVRRVERSASDSDDPSLAFTYLPLYWQGYLYSNSSASAEMGKTFVTERHDFTISVSTSVQCYDGNQSYVSVWNASVGINLDCVPDTPPNNANPNSDLGLERGSFGESFSVMGGDLDLHYDPSTYIDYCTATSGATRTYSPTSIGGSSSSGTIGSMNPSTGASSSVSSTISGTLSVSTFSVDDEGNIIENGGGEENGNGNGDGTDGNGDSDGAGATNTPGLYRTNDYGSNLAVVDETCELQLIASENYYYIHWYVKGPGEVGIGTEMQISGDGYGGETEASFSTVLSSIGDYVITARVYRYSDYTYYDESYTITVQ